MARYKSDCRITSTGIMLSVALLVVTVGCQAALCRSVPSSSAEVGVDELQRLENALETAAMEESLGPYKDIKRVTRERPIDPEDSRSRAVDFNAVGSLTNQLEEEKVKRVTREKPDAVQGNLERDSRQTTESMVHPEERHFHSGASIAYPGTAPLSPHVTFNVPPPHVSYTVAQPPQIVVPPRPPVTNCAGGGCSGGTTIHVHDTHLPVQHVPQTYTATVPFISGYRLTPVIGQKQITLNDWYHSSAAGGLAAGAASGVSSGCAADAGWGGYWQNLYTHGRNAWTAEDLLRPFEDGRYFQTPLEHEHGLAEPKEYDQRIDELKHHIEHLESLKDNVSSAENLIVR